MLKLLMFLIFIPSAAFSADSAEPLTILSVNPSTHEVRVKPSVEVTQEDMGDYEIHLEIGELRCALQVKEYRLRDWVLNTEGCDQTPLTKQSQIWLRLKEKQSTKPKKVENEPAPTKMGFNLALFFNSASSYDLAGDYESQLGKGELDVRGKTSGAPGFAVGLTFPVFRKFELEFGLGYEFERNLKQEDGRIGNSSYSEDYPSEPTLSLLFLFGNFRFYLPKRDFYFFGGLGLGDAMGSSEIAKQMSFLAVAQGGAGYNISENWGVELIARTYSGLLKYEGEISGIGFSAEEATFSLLGLAAAAKYKF